MQSIGLLFFFGRWKESVFAPFPRLDILLAPLDKLVAKLEAQSLPLLAGGGLESGESRVEEGGKTRVSLCITGVRRCGQKHHVTLLAASKRVQQVKALLFPSFAAADTSVGFIDDDEVRTLERKVVATSVRLDEIKTDNGEGINLEQVR